MTGNRTAAFALATPEVELRVTQTGGHLQPVGFRCATALGPRTFQPMHVAPWAGERLPADLPNMLGMLRGDFFCMPFGGNEQPCNGEQHPAHGQTANGVWSLLEQDDLHLRLRMHTDVRPGEVEKLVRLVPGHTVVYQRHTIRDLHGPMNLGHHAMMQFPDIARCGHISVSPFTRGQVFDGQFEQPELGGYTSLKPGSMFETLSRVPLADGSEADLSRYPARRGFEDLVQVFSTPADYAWSAVTVPDAGWAWFSLRRPAVLSGTVLWHSNGGRHYPPWSGRHVNVLGVEDVTSHFDYGLAASASPNAASEAGYRTSFNLSGKPMEVPYLFAVTAIPANFGGVRLIETHIDHVTLTGDDGTVDVPLDVTWLG